jgi:hypothetical protein
MIESLPAGSVVVVKVATPPVPVAGAPLVET